MLKLTEHLSILIVIIPLLFSAINFIFNNKKFGIVSCILSIIFLSYGSLFIAVKVLFNNEIISYHIGSWQPPIGIEYRIDKISALFLLILTYTAISSFLYIVLNKPKQNACFYSLFLLILAGFTGIIVTNDIFNIFVFLEISSLASYGILAQSDNKQALKASFNYMIIGIISASFLLIGIGYLYAITGSLNISDIAVKLKLYNNLKTYSLGLCFILIAIFIKIAIFPMHKWITDIYKNGDFAVVIFLSGISSNIGIYLFIRILFYLFDPVTIFSFHLFKELLIIITATSMVYGAIKAIKSKDLKLLLAYSTISQCSMILFALISDNHNITKMALLLVFVHSFSKSGLFMAAELIEKFNKSNYYLLLPVFVLVSSLGGIPLNGGFVAKLYLLVYYAEYSDWIGFAFILIGAGLSIVYSIRIWLNFMLKPENEIKEKPRFITLLPLYLNSLVLIALSFVPNHILFKIM